MLPYSYLARVSVVLLSVYLQCIRRRFVTETIDVFGVCRVVMLCSCHDMSISVTACLCMYVCWLYVYVYRSDAVVVLTYTDGSPVFETLPSDCSKSNFCIFLTEIRNGFVRSFQ